jgi:PAS domain S-box-containing protein
MAAPVSIVPLRPQPALASELFAAALRDLPDGIMLLEGDDDRIVEVNRTVRHLLGYEPRWLIGRSFDTLLEPPRGGIAARAWRHGLVVSDLELRRIDGSRCAVQLRARPTTIDGRPLVIVTLRDVRERRRAEERHRSLFDNAIEGIFQTTPEGRYIAANPALARIYGYESPDELMAHLTDIAGQLYVDASRRRQFGSLLERGDAVRHFESAVRRKDGTVVWISENARAVRDDDGRLLYYEGTVVDITDRKQAEAAEREQAAVASALVRVGEAMIAAINSPAILDRLCAVTLDALDCDWSHTLLRSAARDAYVPVATADRHPHGLPPSVVPVAAADLAPLLARLAREQVVVLDADACAALPAALRPQGTPCGAAIFFPIHRGESCEGVLMAGGRTRRQPFSHVEERIARGIAHLAAIALAHARALDELARANRLKAEFVATMSHELRTPLNIILGYTEMLRNGAFGSVSGDQRDVLRRVARSGDELLELITATLDLSRLESGRTTVEIATVRLEPLLAAIEGEARELLRDKPAVALRWSVAADLPVVRTDPAKLTVVIKNLVANAAKFTERGHVALCAERRDDGVAVSVRDTGIGIAEEALPIIFDAFRQADGSMTRRYGGVGLGLHVVRRLVTMLGGRVDVASTAGEGSTFCIWIPIV